MADDKKDDLKARLGLKKKGAAVAVPGPVVEGLPPIEPEKPAGPPKPSKESIDAAKKAADAIARQAGPAIEEFGVGRPDKTPLPASLPAAATGGEPRVEYVHVQAEPSPEQERKRILILAGSVLAAGLIAFFFGRSCSGSAVKAELKENITHELKDKQALFKAKEPVFQRIATLEDKLESVNKLVASVTKDKKDPMTLEKPLEELFGELERYANDNVYLAPEDVLGTAVYDPGLMRHLVDYAVRTQIAHGQIVGAVRESKSLKTVSDAPPPEVTTRVLVVETEDRDVPNVGKIPVGKGRWVARPGHPVKSQVTLPDGRVVDDWNQVDVLAVGDNKPMQVKTTQLVQVDLGQFFQEQAMMQKLLAVTRMAKIASDLLPIVRGLDPKPVLDMVNAAPATGL
ncbi:MAG: hypothetical protein U1F43_18310 [Myxococcota bacterium]